jgi:hypothetical protein
MLADKGQLLKTLEAERNKILGQRDARRQARSRLAELESWIETVAANLGELTHDERRLAVDALGVRVLVWRKDDRSPKVEANIPLGDVKSTSSSRSAACKSSVTLQWTDRD